MQSDVVFVSAAVKFEYISRVFLTFIVQSRLISRLFGLQVFFMVFRKSIFDKSTAAISCT